MKSLLKLLASFTPAANVIGIELKCLQMVYALRR